MKCAKKPFIFVLTAILIFTFAFPFSVFADGEIIDPIDLQYDFNSAVTLSLEDLSEEDIEITNTLRWRNSSGSLYSHSTGYKTLTDPLTYYAWNNVTRLYHTDQYYGEYIMIRSKSGGRLAKKGNSFDFLINGILNTIAVSYDTDGSGVKLCYPNTENILDIYVEFYDIEGNKHVIEDIVNFTMDRQYNYAYSFNCDSLPCDVYQFSIVVQYNLFEFYPDLESYADYNIYDYQRSYGFANSTIDVTEESNNSGLLKTILNWLSNIRDNIVELGSKIANGFSNLAQLITELPSKIYDSIINAIKTLLIPDEQFIKNWFDGWDTVLRENLGAVYESGEVAIDFLRGIQVSDATNTISIPSATIDLAGTPFTFGGYEVQIVPDRFSFLADVSKTIISVLCTFAFVNGLIKRYEEVVGVEK